MSDFERKIRDLPWRKPSNELQERIFGTTAERVYLSDDSVREATNARGGMPFKWSVLLAMAAGILGFLAGATVTNPDTRIEVADAKTDIRIVETFSLKNSFDFSGDAAQILPGEFTASIDGDVENVR